MLQIDPEQMEVLLEDKLSDEQKQRVAYRYGLYGAEALEPVAWGKTLKIKSKNLKEEIEKTDALVFRLLKGKAIEGLVIEEKPHEKEESISDNNDNDPDDPNDGLSEKDKGGRHDQGLFHHTE